MVHLIVDQVMEEYAVTVTNTAAAAAAVAGLGLESQEGS
jgi:hypothetical protein